MSLWPEEFLDQPMQPGIDCIEISACKSVRPEKNDSRIKISSSFYQALCHYFFRNMFFFGVQCDISFKPNHALLSMNKLRLLYSNSTFVILYSQVIMVKETI